MTSSTPETDAVLAPAWLKHPWVLLIFGGVISLGLWVGIGLWIEHQRAVAQEQLEQTPGLRGWIAGNARFPIWLPEWLGKQLPEKWQSNIQIIDGSGWAVSRSLTDHEVRLLDRGPRVLIIEFRDVRAVSDDALLNILERHSLERLKFSGWRRLTLQHFVALSRHEHLSTLIGVQGPFDQSMFDELAKIKTLRELKLDGPLEGSARFSTLPALESIEWGHSELNDDQFAGIAAGSKLEVLELRQTGLTARSGPAIERMDLHVLELESPHIDDTTAHSLVGRGALLCVQLRGGGLSDSAIKELLTLPRLRHLEIEGSGLTLASARLMRASMANPESERILPSMVIRGGPHVTDEWLAELADGQWYGIGLVNSGVTDKGVEHLKGHEKLSVLHLPGSGITDRSMPVLSTLKDLFFLDVRNTAITDAGLRQFSLTHKSYVSSFSLHVGGTRITKEGAEEFLSRHPVARVYGVEGMDQAGESDGLIPLDISQPR